MQAAGYQGAASILTCSLEAFANELAGAHIACEVVADVTAAGETARSLFDSVEAGQRQVCYVASGYLAARVPDLSVLDMPFRVSDRDQAMAALDATAGRLLTRAVVERTGLKLLGFWDNGFRHISNGRRAIMSPADCAGLTVRTLDSADYRATMAALGMRPVSLDVRDLRRVVESGEVDAQENPLTNFVNFGLWQHHRHLSLTGHLFGVALLVCNRAWFDALAPAHAQAVLHAGAAATRLQRAWAAQEDSVALEFLAGSGVQVLARDELDLQAMRRCCEALTTQQATRLPADLLAAYPGGAPQADSAEPDD